LDFQKKRDKERREAMNKLFNAVEEAGLYDKTLPAEDEKS